MRTVIHTLLLCLACLGSTAPAGALDCAGLAALRIDEASLHSATVVPAAGGLPEYCRVLGTVRSAIRFEARLPTQAWNGKFYMAGCGGFCGRLDSERPGFTNSISHGLRRGYAVATMDGGHWGSSVTDGRWAWNDRRAEQDWGWRAVTETARVAKILVREHYARPHTQAYFAGCSTGGRMALMEASRFAQDFDGIIAGAPAMDYTGLVATHGAWVTQANTRADGSEILGRGKVPHIAAAVVAACDALDGARDGLVDDPRSCNWSAAALRCKAAPVEDCLTNEEVGVVERWYAGARDSRGNTLYAGGVPRGSESYWPLWLSGIPGNAATPLLPLFTRDFLRYMAFIDDPGESYAVAEFDFDRDPARLAAMAGLYNSDTSDLSAFRARGGRLLIYHGWSDPIVTPLRTVGYYEALMRASGGPVATREFARLFMLPGFDHCGIQAGPGVQDSGFDPLPALEAWVERGLAPQSIDMIKFDAAGREAWRRPVCAYPQLARPGRGGDGAATRHGCVTP